MPKFESDTLDEAYYDRNQAVMLAFVFAQELGYKVGIRLNGDWLIFYIDLPTGQVSWHVPLEHMPTGIWPTYDAEWDGHDLEEKRQRIQKFLARDYDAGSCAG